MKFNLIFATGPKILICYHQKFRIRQRKMSPLITPCSGGSGKSSQVSSLFSHPYDRLPAFLTIEYPRIAVRISEGEAKRNKRSNLEALLAKKIGSFRYPMQELELNYPTTKGKVYSEEEDRYLLCRLSHYGMRTDDVYERIKKDISEFPVFRFDWFFKSRSPQELQRRCNTLLGMIEKEAEQEEIRAKSGGSSSRGKVSWPCKGYKRVKGADAPVSRNE
jgi:hypothetical protein